MSIKSTKFASLLPPALLLLAVFGATLILFLELQPFILFDTDDWQLISLQRPMIPTPTTWNPTRVFPKVFMPLCGNVAAYVIMPFTGDYVEAIRIECALVYSVGIVIYVGMFYALVRKRFAATVSSAIFATSLFYLFHFIVIAGTTHLFETSTVTNLFYYALSNILCCSIVLYLMRNDMLVDFFSPRHVVKKGVFLALMYLALASNIFASIIVASYVGIDLLLRFIEAVRKKSRMRAFFAKHAASLVVLGFWALCQVLDATGGRARSLEGAPSFAEGILSSFSSFCGKGYDLLFIGIALVIVVAFCAMVLRHKAEVLADPRNRVIGVTALAAVLTFLYLILLCARAGAWYITRADVLASLFFFVITAVVLCLVVLMNRYPRILLALPVVILFVLFYIHPAPDSTSYGLASAERAAITDDVIEQIKEGADAGESEIELRVPVFSTKDNWPFADYADWTFAETLYRHGIIDHEVTVQMIPDPEMNEKYGIPLP